MALDDISRDATDIRMVDAITDFPKISDGIAMEDWSRYESRSRYQAFAIPFVGEACYRYELASKIINPHGEPDGC